MTEERKKTSLQYNNITKPTKKNKTKKNAKSHVMNE